MNIHIVSETEQVYTPEYGVPTIHLGDGWTVVSDVHCDDGLHGICFSEASVNNGVGGDQGNLKGRKVDEIGAYFQILTNNPKSIEVLIDKLEKAKAALELDVR